MRVVSKIDAQNFFVEDVILQDDAPLPEGCIESRPPEGFHRPRWDSASLAWVEGLPASVLLDRAKEEKKAEFDQRMHLEIAALYPETQAVENSEAAVSREMVIDLMSDPRPARATGVKQNRDRRNRGHEAIDAQTTLQGVQGVTWEGV